LPKFIQPSIQNQSLRKIHPNWPLVHYGCNGLMVMALGWGSEHREFKPWQEPSDNL